MFLTIGLIATGLYLYRHSRQRGHMANPLRDSRSRARAQASGEQGERLTQTKLRETLDLLSKDDYYLHDGPIILVHAPGSEYPTIEIDHFAVTRFGVFVLETKHWAGQIGPSSNQGCLLRLSRTGMTEERKSPLLQNRSKLAFIRAHLPRQWSVAGAGVFTSTEAHLSPHLPSDLFALNDLPLWLRTQRDRNAGRAPIDITKAVHAIVQYQDCSLTAAAEHKNRLAPKKQHIGAIGKF
jgi:Nuclease-related domain